MIKMKKLLAIGLAAAMTLGLCSPAMAATETTGRMEDDKGTITIKNTVKDETYNVYKIFDLQSFADDNVNINNHSGDRYSYLLPTNSPWVDFFQNGAGKDYVDVDFEQTHIVTVGTTDYYQVTGYKLKGYDQATTGFDEAYAEGTKNFETDFINTNTYYAQSAQAFARAALAYATAETGNPPAVRISPDYNQTSSNGGDITITTSADLGYYLLSTSAGTLLSLDSTNLTATVYEKNVAPTNKKTVQEDGSKTQDSTALGDGKLGDAKTDYKVSNDANIGQRVDYRTVINVEKGAVGYVMQDEMSDGLTLLPDSVKVYLTKQANAEDASAANWQRLSNQTAMSITWATGKTTSYDASNTFYTLKTTNITGKKDITNPDFEIDFNQDFLNDIDTYTTGTTTSDKWSLVVLYSATLNSGAVIDGNGNTNKMQVTFGADQKTVLETATTYTWELDIFKFTGISPSVALDGAQFQIKYGTGANQKTLKFVNVSDGVYRYDDRVQSATIPAKGSTDKEDVIKEGTATVDSADVSVVDTITTSSGKLVITGLDGDDYIIEETLAPKGYNKLANPINVHITSDTEGTAGTIKYGDNETAATKGQVVRYDTIPHSLAIANSANKDVQIDIRNEAGVELPSTGGIGTTIFYILGSILVVGAGIVLVAKRRMTLN